MSTQSTVIDNAISQAKEMGKGVREQMFGNLSNDAFVAIDTSYPEMIQTNATPATKSANRAKHQGYIDRMSKLMLTSSLFLGLGIEPPEGHALKKELAAELAGMMDATFIKLEDPEYGEITVATVNLGDGDAEYRFKETDLHLAYLRALHFATTRNDPDLTEFINRKLADNAGLNDANWLDAAYAADEAKKADTPEAQA